MNIHDLVGAQIDFGNRRKLQNSDLVNQVVSRFYLDKIQFQTLVTLTKNFFSTVNVSELLQFSPIYVSDSSLDFEFEGKTWTGSVTKEVSKYSNTPNWSFVNIKLPNDSFIYTSAYQDPYDDLKNNQETENLIDLLAENLVKYLPDFQWVMRVNYKQHDGRLEFYFEDTERKQTVTVKYEYGTYKYYNNNLKKKYTREEIQKRLDNK